MCKDVSLRLYVFTLYCFREVQIGLTILLQRGLWIRAPQNLIVAHKYLMSQQQNSLPGTRQKWAFARYFGELTWFVPFSCLSANLQQCQRNQASLANTGASRQLPQRRAHVAKFCAEIPHHQDNCGVSTRFNLDEYSIFCLYIMYSIFIYIQVNIQYREYQEYILPV